MLTEVSDKKKGPQTADLNLFDGAPGRIRTPLINQAFQGDFTSVPLFVSLLYNSDRLNPFLSLLA